MVAVDEIHRQIVEASDDGLWVVDAQGRTVFANARVGELLGRSADEIASGRMADLLEGVDTTSLTMTERALHDADGAYVGQLYRLVDDGGRQALLEEVRLGQSRLAEAQSIARLGSWEIRNRPYGVTWSRAMYDVLGVDPESFDAGFESFVSLILEKDRQGAVENWMRIETEPGERAIDVRIRRGDGVVRWVRAVGQVLEWSEHGRPLRIGGTVQDIHELKQAEQLLLDAVEVNTLMQFLATAANEASTFDEALDKLRQLLLAHHDWQRGVAFDADLQGRLTFRPVYDDDPFVPTDLERDVAARACASGAAVFEEDAQPESPLIGFPVVLVERVVAVLVITARSHFERHQMMHSLVSQVAGQLAQVVARERAAGEIAAARDLALAASQAKSEFLAMMSHEIRTPLNGVIGLNDLLLHTSLDDRQRELADAMQGAGRALLVLISDILDFSKIEAGRLDLEAVEFRPKVVVDGVRDLFAADALSRGIALEVALDAGVPAHLEGDPSRFGQILSNLVSNAVKFTHEGRVRVTVSAVTSGQEVTLRVEVADTGIGLDADQQSRIFQPFRQADVSTNRTFGGTGLGLAIAHRLAGAMGGEIGVRSVPGEGSSFWFTSCFRVPAERSRVVAPEATTGSGGGHVLVVEDNEVNQLVAVGMLEVLGYTSEVAGDGAAAAARVAAGRFDAVLMDLQMPRLDGFAATRLIRQSEAPGVRVPIIALTASATAGEEGRCRAAGMTGFLTKPVRLESLGTVLAAQLANRDEASRPLTPSAEPTGAALVVLDGGRLGELAEMGEAAVPLIRQAIDNFVAAAPGSIDLLRRLWRERDSAGLRSVAHKLKGSAANLGANRVAAVALTLEEFADQNVLDRVGPALVELAGELDEAVAALAAYEIRVVDETSRSA